MSQFNLEPKVREIVEVDVVDRWLVYKRLRELDIPCWCSVDQPLQVEIKTALQGIQLGSVLRQFKAPRRELLQSLENCWQTS